MSLVRIESPAWALYNGKLGGVKFNNGVSERPLTDKELRRVGGNVRIVDHETGEHIQIHKPLYAQAAKPLVNAPTGAQETPLKSFVSPVQSEADVEASLEPKELKWSLEALEEIADAKGIKGIREVAAEYNVKGVQISQLIDGILLAQGAFVEGK